MTWVDVCAMDEVAQGRLNGFDAGGRRVILMSFDGHLVALDGTCTHEEADLSTGFLLAGRITCPLHLSQFDARTGEVYNPPAEKALPKYGVKTEGGRVFVDLPQ
jgi:3-phenylpropionate/trans-cinnamate dioxygenase ferredoxin component